MRRRSKSGLRWIHCQIKAQTHTCLCLTGDLEDKQLTDVITEILDEWVSKNVKAIAAKLKA